ncbi:translation initiation factor IF2/IF5 [Melanomma pulvis-pyrius CBS 109.77]|uniref:Translation initiation factor IF2/IF5 n=1 Tax=Melanomma pulvis-pyrius CBS 109.77 TaxID=1314802 RepID=A0A6A6XH33_9PLEO|nr:translation initiation factor IF2/IF5 [Melanomma pulvis-pyrius CBS 109.77]
MTQKIATVFLSTHHNENNPILGTGIFAHNATDTIPYHLLLHRLFLQQNHYPRLNTYTKDEKPCPNVHILVERNKKTIFANFWDVCQGLGRDRDHVAQYLIKELGTNGSFDQWGRLVVKGRFVARQIENAIKRYKKQYVVICSSCESRDTSLSKTETRALLLTVGNYCFYEAKLC